MSVLQCTGRGFVPAAMPYGPPTSTRSPFDLSIRLSDAQQSIYCPGDMISGVVRVTTRADQPIDSVAVNFHGSCKVVLMNRVGDLTASRPQQKSCGCLFRRYLNLERYSGLHDAGTYMWPFAFTMPEHTDSHLDGSITTGEIFEHRAPWKGSDAAETHAIPPSMAYQSNDFLCCVQYELEVRAIHASQPFSRIISCSKTIEVRPVLERHGFSELAKDLYSTYYHEFLLGDVPSIKRRIRSMLGKPAIHSTPNHDANLLIKVSTPTRLWSISGCSVPVWLWAIRTTAPEIQPKALAASSEFSDILCVNEFSIWLTVRTIVRAGGHRPMERKKMLLGKGSSRLPVSRAFNIRINPERTWPVVGTTTDLGIRLQACLPSTTFTTSFCTYNISLSYCLEVRLGLEYAGKQLKYTFTDLPIQLMATKIASAQPDNLFIAAGSDLSRESRRDKEELPEYRP